MIDRDTAISFVREIAKPERITPFSSDMDMVTLGVDELQALITRAQNEAYDSAAKECDKLSECANHPDDINGFGCAVAIRALKPTHSGDIKQLGGGA